MKKAQKENLIRGLSTQQQQDLAEADQKRKDQAARELEAKKQAQAEQAAEAQTNAVKRHDLYKAKEEELQQEKAKTANMQGDVKRREDRKAKQTKQRADPCKDGDATWWSTGWNFVLHWFPFVIVLLAIVSVRTVTNRKTANTALEAAQDQYDKAQADYTANKPKGTATPTPIQIANQKTAQAAMNAATVQKAKAKHLTQDQQLVYGQMLLAILLVMAMGMRSDFPDTKQNLLPGTLTVGVAVLGGMSAAKTKDTHVMVVSICLILASALHVISCFKAPNCTDKYSAPPRMLYDLVGQLEHIRWINAMVMGILLIWIFMQLTNLYMGYPSTNTEGEPDVAVWYPDNQMPKTFKYKLVRALEFLLILFLFIGMMDVKTPQSGGKTPQSGGKIPQSGGKIPTTTLGKFTKLVANVPDRIAHVLSGENGGKIRMFLVLTFLVICGGYMFAAQGYASFAVDTALLGFVLVSGKQGQQDLS